MRGFNQRLSNKVLVLVDGRSVYVDLLGSTFWATLPIGVEDIERIEVVRGPGSALYGADAFNGVVNIITKAPGRGRQRRQRRLRQPERGARHGLVDRARRASSRTACRPASTTCRAGAARSRPNRNVVHTYVNDQDMSGQHRPHRRRRSRGSFGKDIVAGVSARYDGGQTEILGDGPINDDVIIGEQTQDATAYLKSKHFEVRELLDAHDRAERAQRRADRPVAPPVDLQPNVVDAEAQYIANFETGRGIEHDLHVGVAYRLKHVEWTYLVNNETREPRRPLRPRRGEARPAVRRRRRLPRRLRPVPRRASSSRRAGRSSSTRPSSPRSAGSSPRRSGRRPSSSRTSACPSSSRPPARKLTTPRQTSRIR